MTTQDLIARLEKATGPDRELDYSIHRYLQKGFNWSRDYLEKTNELPAYTESIDAARSLSDWILIYASDIGADGMALVKLGNPSVTPTIEVTGIAMNIERAWCIAALLAKVNQ